MNTITTLSLAPTLAWVARGALRALASRLSGAYADWTRHRKIRITARLLNQLDDRTLHDLALNRSELLSVAAEVHGQTGRERRVAS